MTGHKIPAGRTGGLIPARFAGRTIDSVEAMHIASTLLIIRFITKSCGMNTMGQ